MQTTVYPRRQTKYRSPSHIERSPLDFATIFFGLILATLLLTMILWQFWHANRIYTGIHVAGVPIGGMTRAAAMRALSQELSNFPTPPISVMHGGQRWPLLDSSPTATNSSTASPQLNAQADLLSAVNQAYLVGRQGSLGEQLLAQASVALMGHEIRPTVSYDRGQLRYLLSRVAEEVRQPARPGRQVGGVEVPPQPGVAVDVEASLQAVLNSLENAAPAQAIVVPLVTTTLAPPPADEAPLLVSTAAAQTPAPAPLLVRNERMGIEMAMDPAQLGALLLSTTPPQLDPDGLHALLTEWAAQIDVPARDARLQFNPNTGTINVLQTSRAGRQLDIERTATAIQAAVATRQPQAAMVITEIEPAVDMARIPEMGIKELVISGVSYFAGSSAARIRNIEVAAEKFEGVVIPPDGIFSFNDIVQDVTSANGFEDSLIIWGDQTAVGVGGGVCQVSTTIFRAAYEGGFPIVERYNHGYVVSWYGEPGMDATIYTPTVDFRFRNDTGAYLLIDPVVDSINGVIRFDLYGTKPNRQVTISEAKYTDIIEPEPPRYVEDPSLAAGQIKQVEWEQRGMTVEIQRTIVENGETRTDTLRSVYRPWRAEYLYGPGTDIPTPEPTEVPNAEATDAPAIESTPTP